LSGYRLFRGAYKTPTSAYFHKVIQHLLAVCPPIFAVALEPMVRCELLGRAVPVIPVIPVISYKMKKKSQTCRAAPEKVGL
jgi:hypothetical protein